MAKSGSRHGIFTGVVSFADTLSCRRWILFLLSLGLAACGGGSGGGKSYAAASLSSLSTTNSQSSSTNSLISSSATSSADPTVIISGKITFDYVPANTNHVGLDYAATSARPGRGLVVELVNASGGIVSSGVTDNEGRYTLAAPPQQPVKVRVKAQLLSTTEPAWDFAVKDNTRDGALYTMVGELASSGLDNSQRDLHANSGWTGDHYGDTRVAAPFAILDAIYGAVQTFSTAGNRRDFPALNFYWSEKNIAANGDPTLGEIGTSFYDFDSIYVLGAEDNDTDEYDSHVILHEWGHYIENKLSRTSTLGGNHPQHAKLDMRLAMSEGFSTALAAMMLNDPFYRDTSQLRQADGFYLDVSQAPTITRGWYAEDSISYVLFNYYQSGSGKTERDFAPIYNAFTAESYIRFPGFISIFTFADQLKTQNPHDAALLDSLLVNQDIHVNDAWGTGESNSGLYAKNLPIYKMLALGESVNVCSTNRFGTINALGVYQFARFNIPSAGTYSLQAMRSGGDATQTDPDFVIYRAGNEFFRAESATDNSEYALTNLQAGDYVVEFTDDRNRREDETGNAESCFDLTLTSY